MMKTSDNRSFRERHPNLFRSPEEQRERNERAIAMLQRLRDDGDPQEQKETGEILMTALAKARESNREPDAKGNDPMIQTIERKRTLRERHPELFPTPEETKARNKDAIAVLQRFVDEGDGQEQRETCDLLMKALAESRESNREPETK